MSRPRMAGLRRLSFAVATAATIVLVAAPGAAADVSAVYSDREFDSYLGGRPDSGFSAPDLVRLVLTHEDGDPGIASDDALRFDLTLKGGQNEDGSRAPDTELRHGDRVEFAFDVDDNADTGHDNPMEGFDGVYTDGSERFIEIGADRRVNLSDENHRPLIGVPITTPNAQTVSWRFSLAQMAIRRGARVRFNGLSSTSAFCRACAEEGESPSDIFPINNYLHVPGGDFRPGVASAASVTGVTSGAAVLNGSVDPHGLATVARFQYGPTTNYGAETAAVAVGPGSGLQPVNVAVRDLAPGTTYHFRLVAQNAEGTQVGPNQTFTTRSADGDIDGAKARPAAQTRSAEAIGQTSGVLRGTVEPNGEPTRYRFEWGPTRSYGRTTPERTVAGSVKVQEVDGLLTGLERDTVYHYRLVATSAGGEHVGQDVAFRTSRRPRPASIESDFPLVHACTRRTRRCTVPTARLRVEVRHGETRKPLGAAARRAVELEVRVGGERRRLPVDGTPRVRAFGSTARPELVVRRNEQASRVDLKRLFQRRFLPGDYIELRLRAPGMQGRYHRIFFTRREVLRTDCILPVGSDRPTRCRKL